MLWRSAYRTLVAKELPLPSTPCVHGAQIIIGAFNFRGIREMSLWRRLIEVDAPRFTWKQVIFLSAPTTQEFDMLDSVFPPSQRERSFILVDEGEAWRLLVEPDRPEQAFAAVISGNEARIMMKGVPTEEAWDAFLEQLS